MLTIDGFDFGAVPGGRNRFDIIDIVQGIFICSVNGEAAARAWLSRKYYSMTFEVP